jgi:surface antigen
MKLINRSLVLGRIFFLVSVLLVMLLSQITGMAFAQDTCPSGMSSLDCQSLLYDWTQWIPEYCSSTGQAPLSIPSWGSQVFTSAANQYNVSPALVAAIYWREHGGSWEEPPPPYGNGTPYANSGVGGAWPDGILGARGPFQFEYTTWLGYANSDPNQPINTKDNQAVIQGVEDLEIAAYGAAKKLADLGGVTSNPVGDISNTLQPNTIVNAIRAYNEGAAATNPDLSYVEPALEAYNALTGSVAGGSCSTSVGAGNGICTTTLEGDGRQAGSWQPLCPWIPQGGYPAAQLYVNEGDGGQCTWWAAYNLSYNPGGSGGRWYSNAVLKNMPTEPASDGPKVGEAVSYSYRPGGRAGLGPTDTAGHVAYIVAVAANGQSYTISEANYNFIPWQVDARTVPYPDPDINGFIGVDPAATSWLASHPGAGQ